MAEETLLVLGAALAFAFGWNNSSYLIGNDQGSGTLTLSEALITSSTGLLFGVLILGPKMMKSLSGDITPSAGDQVVLVGLVVALLLTVALSVVKLPVSFSTVVVGGFAGRGLRLRPPPERSQDGRDRWVLGPLAARRRGPLLRRVQGDREGDGRTEYPGARPLQQGRRHSDIRGGRLRPGSQQHRPSSTGPRYGRRHPCSSRSSSRSSPSQGWSCWGGPASRPPWATKLLDLSPLGVVATFLSSWVLMLLGTEFGLPISIGQCLLGGMFGAAYTKKVTVINRKIAFESVALGVWPARSLCACVPREPALGVRFFEGLVHAADGALGVSDERPRYLGEPPLEAGPVLGVYEPLERGELLDQGAEEL